MEGNGLADFRIRELGLFNIDMLLSQFRCKVLLENWIFITLSNESSGEICKTLQIVLTVRYS